MLGFGHDAFDLLDRAGRGVDVGAPELRRQQLLAAEHVQRQVAVAIVIAVEEAAFLMAVQRSISGVEIKDDRARRRLCASRKRSTNKRTVVLDLVVAEGSDGA